MPRSLDDLDARMGRFLQDEWLKLMGWTRDDWRRFYEAGVPAEWAATIAELTHGLIAVEDWPRLLHPPKALHRGRQKSTVNSDMLTAEHRMAIAAGSKPGGNRPAKDPFRAHIRARGYTQNSLADKLDVDKALLSRYRRKRNPVAIPDARAKRIQQLTDWPADAAHWPGGIS